MTDAATRATTEPSVLAEARALLVAGEAQRAIEVLSAANRTAPDPEVEQALVHTRNEAYRVVDRAPRRRDWPPALADPFPEVVDEVPWTSPDRLDVATVGGSVLHHGCVGVRGLLSTERAGEFARATDEVFATRATLLDAPDAATAPGEPDAGSGSYQPFDPVVGSQVLRSRRAWVRDAGAVWAADAPHLLFEVLEDLGRVGYLDVVEGYLGERPVLSVNKSVMRRVAPSAYPAWHQDGAFLGDEVRALNLWVALTPCGGGDGDAPALEVVPRRLDGLCRTGTEGAYLGTEVAPPVVAEVAEGAGTRQPRFEPGDALIFDEIFLHRTSVDETMTRDRNAIEWWCFAPSGFTKGYVPLVV